MGKNQDKKDTKKRADEWRELRINQIKAKAEQNEKAYDATLPYTYADNITEPTPQPGGYWKPAYNPDYWPKPLKKKESVHIPNREHKKEERCHYCAKHHDTGRLVTINGEKEIRKICPDCLIKALDLLLKGDVTIEIVEE